MTKNCRSCAQLLSFVGKSASLGLIAIGYLFATNVSQAEELGQYGVNQGFRYTPNGNAIYVGRDIESLRKYVNPGWDSDCGPAGQCGPVLPTSPIGPLPGGTGLY